MKNSLLIFIALLLGLCCGWYIHRPSVEFVTRVDTVTIDHPVLVHDTLITHDVIRVPVHTTDTVQDVIVSHDTSFVYVDIPITQRTYSSPQYTAWVSGYHPSLDSIQVYNTTRTVVDNSVKFGGFGTLTAAYHPSADVGVFLTLPKYSIDAKLGYHIQEGYNSPFLGVTYYFSFR